MREFKDIFKNLRLDKDMTQDELADALRITKQAVSHYERGTRYPKPDMLDAISDYFNVDMDYLTGEVFPDDEAPHRRGAPTFECL